MPAKTPPTQSASPNHPSYTGHSSLEHQSSRVHRSLSELGHVQLSRASEDHRLPLLLRVLPERRVWGAAYEVNPKKTWEHTTGGPQTDISDAGAGGEGMGLGDQVAPCRSQGAAADCCACED